MIKEFPPASSGPIPPTMPDTSLAIAREKLLARFYLPTREEIKKALPSHDDFYKFCFRDYKVFEFWNKEYMNAFADYLADRVAKLGKLSIVEIGAGNGRFSTLLEIVLQEKGLDGVIEIMPTDSNGWGLADKFSVVEMDYIEALETFKPDIVISSWMPARTDWTKTIRQFDSVKEYILIGDPTCCGDGERTWGNSFLEDPFSVDSFEREEITNLHRLQICYKDIFDEHAVNKEENTNPHSYTVSFKRV